MLQTLPTTVRVDRCTYHLFADGGQVFYSALPSPGGLRLDGARMCAIETQPAGGRERGIEHLIAVGKQVVGAAVDPNCRSQGLQHGESPVVGIAPADNSRQRPVPGAGNAGALSCPAWFRGL